MVCQKLIRSTPLGFPLAFTTTSSAAQQTRKKKGKSPKSPLHNNINMEISRLMQKISRTLSNTISKDDPEWHRKKFKEKEAKLLRKKTKLQLEKEKFEADQREKAERAKQDERNLHAGLENRRRRRQDELLPRIKRNPPNRFSMMPALAQESHSEGTAFVRKDSPPLPGEKPRWKASRHPTYPKQPVTADSKTITQLPLARESRSSKSAGTLVIRPSTSDGTEYINRPLPPLPAPCRPPMPVHQPKPRRQVRVDVLENDLRNRQSPMSVARGRHPTRPDSPTPLTGLMFYETDSSLLSPIPIQARK